MVNIQWFSMVLSGSEQFLITVGGFQRFTVFFSSYQWVSTVLVGLNDYQWFSMAPSGSEWL